MMPSSAAERIGGLFMVGLPGLDLDNSTRELIARQRINHFILFKRNVGSPSQLSALCQSLKAACGDAGLAPPLIAIDQEGGTVARLKAPDFTEFADAAVLAASPQAESLLTEFAKTSARELLALGINWNLAPVLDVCPAEEGLVMARRSLGGDPVKTARLGALLIEAMQSRGLAACAKHFPGLGTVGLDPHEARPVVNRSRQELAASDLLPFQAAMAVGVAAIMTSHTLYPQLDPKQPATLSAPILSGLLRKDLGYQGLIVTDDLEMGAIEKEGTVAEAALAAFLAGADLLLICHDHAKILAAHQGLSKSLAEGSLAEERLDRSLARIEQVRQRFAS